MDIKMYSSGELEKLYQKGKDYYYGQEGIYPNDSEAEKAAKYLKQAAELGHAGAQYLLGDCYCNGQGVSWDYSQAVVWYRKAAGQWSKAAEQGDAEAQYNLGRCFIIGKGVEENKFEALKWYKKAAEQGHAKAQAALERMGKVRPKILFEQAVGGNGKSQTDSKSYSAEELFQMGKDYHLGKNGIGQNHERAFECWKQAAEQGHAKAQNNLGVCYEKGNGIHKDDSEAVKWYRKAAEQGDAKAQAALERMGKVRLKTPFEKACGGNGKSQPDSDPFPDLFDVFFGKKS